MREKRHAFQCWGRGRSFKGKLVWHIQEQTVSQYSMNYDSTPALLLNFQSPIQKTSDALVDNSMQFVFERSIVSESIFQGPFLELSSFLGRVLHVYVVHLGL